MKIMELHEMQNNVRRHSSNPQATGSTHRTASRSASFKLGKKGTAGNPAPSWIPNLRRESTYDSRPSKSVRQQMPETFQSLEPEQGSRIFVSGLPKDITNQDLEDLMSSQIGPTREVYIIHQYTGHPLYKNSSATSSGLERDPNAESAENIRFLSSTGCGMVHFQREKDALEAWEQYNGKLLDGGGKVLRVQIVVDADESWLLPQEDRREMAIIEEPNTGMEVEPAYEPPPTQPRTMEPRNPSPTLPTQPETARGPASAQVSRRSHGAPAPKQSQVLRAKPIAKQTHPNVQPLSTPLSNLSLLNRIGTVGTLSETVKAVKGNPSGSIAFGGHSISLNGFVSSSPPMTVQPMAPKTTLPNGKIKKGPRRLAKLEARNQQLRDGATITFSLPVPAHSFPVQPNGVTNGASHAPPGRPTVVDLDAEMEEYRRTGLMGLSSPGGR